MGGDFEEFGRDSSPNTMHGDITYARLCKYNAVTGKWDRVVDLGASSKTADLAPTGSNVTGLTAANQNYTLPTAGGEYLLIASGNIAYVNEGTAPVMTVGGDGIVCPEGVPIGPFTLTGPDLGIISVSPNGYLYVVEIS